MHLLQLQDVEGEEFCLLEAHSNQMEDKTEVIVLKEANKIYLKNDWEDVDDFIDILNKKLVKHRIEVYRAYTSILTMG